MHETARTTIAYQGEPGAYSEAAVHAHFGPHADARGLASFWGAARAVLAGDASGAVIPVHNSTTGIVQVGAEAVARGVAEGLTQEAEVVLPVRHALMALPGVPLAEIRRVRSHPEALLQVAPWLAVHLPTAVAQPGPASGPDTAGAAREIAARLWRDAAAVAHPAAADRYGLEVLARGITDDPANTTTFAVLVR